MKSRQHIQSLIEETQKILREINNGNSSNNANTVHDLHMLTADTNNVNKDLKELNSQLTRLEDGYTLCMKEKYQLSTALHTCKDSAGKTGANALMSEPCPNVQHTALPPISALKSTLSSSDRWLVIGIPTVARAHDEDYLLQSLDTLAAQLPSDQADLMFNKILVNVINLQVNAQPEKEHVMYTRAKAKYSAASGHPKANYFIFSEITHDEILRDPVPNSSPRDKGNANKPGYLVRRQTRNIVTVMRKSLHQAEYYLFLEDDMQFCANGLLAMQYLLNKASRYHPNWLAIRASYGMNGIFMHDKDLETFADYLLKHQARRPPDHLVVEWYAGETPEAGAYKAHRANIGFKYNLFNHIGVVSTLRSQRSTSYPKCYEPLLEPTVFQVEAFSPRDCPRDDVWPCNVKTPDKFKIDWANQ
jgi:hypothetical protein